MPLFIDDFGHNNSVDVPSDMVQSLNGRIKFNGDGNTVKLESGTSSIDFFMELGNGNEVRIGKNCSLGKMNLFAKNHCEFILGESCAFTYVNRYLMHEPTKIHIGNGCLFADGVQMMTSDMHAIVDVNSGERQNYAKDIEIGTHVWLGDHVTILKGVRIGAGSIIGAFAVVTKPIPEFCIAAGNPSRIVRHGTTWQHKIPDETAQTNLQVLQYENDWLTVENLEILQRKISDTEPDRISKYVGHEETRILTPNPHYGTEFDTIKGEIGDFDIFDSDTYHVPNPISFEIQNGELITQFGILKIGNLVSRESLFHFPGHKVPSFKKMVRDDGSEIISVGKNKKTLKMSYGYSAQSGIQENYYHWMVLILSKINSRFLSGITYPMPTIIFSPFENEIQRESAEIIAGHHGLSFVSVDDDVTVQVDRLVYPTINRAGGLRPENLVKDTFATLKKVLLNRNVFVSERIYISRRDSNNRVLRNEEEVEEILSKQFGYEIISLKGKSLSEQVNLFAGARFVISPHGAGLTNIGFCEPGACILEFQMPGYLTWCYRRLACLNNLQYGFIFGGFISDVSLHIHLRSYEINPNELVKAVSSMEAFRGLAH